MQVKIITSLEHLPKVFITEDLNKFSITEKFVDCTKYVSRSGATFSKCMLVSTGGNIEIKETRGIYFTPNPALISISFRQKALDVKDIEDTIRDVLKLSLTKVSPKNSVFLVKCNNYKIEVHDIYYKGKRYEFVKKAEQGNLAIYEVPRVKEAYRVEYLDNKPIEKLNEDLFEVTKELVIYNHKINFETEVMRFKNLFVTPGAGELVYVPNSTKVTVYSEDHGRTEFFVYPSWFLFSHPYPKKHD